MPPPTSSQLINPSTAYPGTFHNKRNGSCVNIRSGYDGLYLKERRGKSVEFLNVDRVRFFPSGTWDKDLVHRVRNLAVLKGGAYTPALLALHGTVDNLVEFIKSIYEKGI